MLTSKDISWSYGMTIAVVVKLSGLTRMQCNLILEIKGQLFSIDGEWIDREVYYIVYR